MYMKMNSGSTYGIKFWMCIIEDVDGDKNKFYMRPHQNYTGVLIIVYLTFYKLWVSSKDLVGQFYK